MPNSNRAVANDACCNRQANKAISADVRKIYDSCADRDCLEDIELVFPETDAPLIDTACSVKAVNAEILTAYVDVDEVSYNRGCYNVEVNYFFTVECDLYQPGVNTPDRIVGVCTFQKNCILYGATGDVYTFTSADSVDLPISVAEPVAKVQAMEPMLLGSNIVANRRPTCVQIPEAVNASQGGDLVQNTGERKIVVTLGLFSIMQLGRDVQVTLPSYEFAVPEKECNVDNASPCDVFRSFDFPLDEFFPQNGSGCNVCGCDTEMDYEGECPNQNRGGRVGNQRR